MHQVVLLDEDIFRTVSHVTVGLGTCRAVFFSAEHMQPTLRHVGPGIMKHHGLGVCSGVSTNIGRKPRKLD
jgi:hypothetical protein